jgi:glycerol-3-phosphate dehydrogenase
VSEFSHRTRRRALAEAASRGVDLLVIGGGITGSGVAWDAASRGLSTLLIERRDFGHATSSRTSKMIHGGLRYLRHLRFSLVRESLAERRILARLAPSYVRWLPLTIPLYRWSEGLTLRAGLSLYDALARDPEHRHRKLTAAQVSARFPALHRQGLRGGLQYWDCLMDDARLNLAVAAAAAQQGALVANYAAAVDIGRDESGFVVTVRDVLHNEERPVSARTVVNAAGPWVDAVRGLEDPTAPPQLHPNRGGHLLFSTERLPVDGGLALPFARDRLLFVIPWQGRVVVGTTEAEFRGELDRVGAESEDWEAILSLARRFLPSADLGRQDVLSSYAGVRPLIGGTNSSLTRMSREHRILESDSGLISVAGGKYTTFRRMAERVVDRVALKLDPLGKRFARCRTAELSLEQALPPPPGLIPSREEVAHLVQQEMALSLSDILVRRSPAVLVAEGQALAEAREVSRWAAECLGWSEAERQAQLERYREEATRLFTSGKGS